MMPRRGGKRIRMDDPVPPEYQEPMTPMTDPMGSERSEGPEHYGGFTPYNQAPQTPAHTPM